MGKLWAWFDNRKTIIAACYWQVSMIITTIWFPNGLPGDLNKIHLTIGSLLTAIGLGHKTFKQFIAVKGPEL